ncbi:MAG: hypothetical protein JWQ98_551 [Chlorobi bacterium]|nr:hypothetical protein [Chlorobiota bacterium]
MSVIQLRQAAIMPIEKYDPSIVIDGVNALQPLGREAAIREIESAVEGIAGMEYPIGIFWVLRVLFDPPMGEDFPPVVLGTPTIHPPDPGELPRFPIVILRDIPLLVVGGYLLRGLPEPVENHIAYFREHGIIRPQPLAPPASLDGIAEEFRQLWKRSYGDVYMEEATGLVDAQLARLAR